MMKDIGFMKTILMHRAVVFAIVIMGLGIGSCVNNSRSVPEADYSTKIAGRWFGTVGELKETMSIDSNGTFVCQLHPTGFIGRTFSPTVTGTVRGTWKITGAIITLRITGAEDKRFGNKITSSAIVTFREDELVLKSDRGETSSFRRVRVL